MSAVNGLYFYCLLEYIGSHSFGNRIFNLNSIYQTSCKSNPIWDVCFLNLQCQREPEREVGCGRYDEHVAEKRSWKKQEKVKKLHLSFFAFAFLHSHVLHWHMFSLSKCFSNQIIYWSNNSSHAVLMTVKQLSYNRNWKEENNNKCPQALYLQWNPCVYLLLWICLLKTY